MFTPDAQTTSEIIEPRQTLVSPTQLGSNLTYRNGATMNLLTWVRGPLLWLSLAIFFTGIFWRMFSLWRLPVNQKPQAHERIAFDTQDAFKAATGGAAKPATPAKKG